MDTQKYKSISVPVDVYEIIKHTSADDERTMTKTLSRYFMAGLEAECDDVNLDTKLTGGGTPRMVRMIEDLAWLRDNTGTNLDKSYIVDEEERLAILRVLDALLDMVE